MLAEIDEVAAYDSPVDASTFANRFSLGGAGGATGSDYDEFTYDANGNRTAGQGGNRSFGYSDSDRPGLDSGDVVLACIGTGPSTLSLLSAAIESRPEFEGEISSSVCVFSM